MSILAHTGYSRNPDAMRAAIEAANMAAAVVSQPDALILFASIYYDHEAVSVGIRTVFPEIPLIGASAFGEMTSHGMYNNSIALMAIQSDTVRFSIGLGNYSDKDPLQTGSEAGRNILCGTAPQQGGAGILLSEMVGGYNVLNGAIDSLPSGFSILGGCSSGDRKVPVTNPAYVRGYQYINDCVCNHNAALLSMGGDFKSVFGIGHGWKPLGKTVRVGKSENNLICNLGDTSAHAYYQHYLGDKAYAPYPLGFEHSGQLILRAVTGIKDDGAMTFTTDIPTGTEVRMTIANREDLFESAQQTAERIHNELLSSGVKPRFAAIISCISRRKMMGSRTRRELECVQEVVGKDLPLIGAYCAGEFAPVSDTNFYHNFTFCMGIIGETVDAPKKSSLPEICISDTADKKRIVIISSSKQCFKECRGALEKIDSISCEWVEPDANLVRQIKIKMPLAAVVDSMSGVTIETIKNADPDLSVIVLPTGDAPFDSDDSLILEDNLCICEHPFDRKAFSKVVQKAVLLTRLKQQNRMLKLELAESKELLDESENHVEATEQAVMASNAEISSAHDYINSIIENMMDALLVVTPDGIIKTVNHAATELLEYTVSELQGQSPKIIFPERIREIELNHLLYGGATGDRQSCLITVNGTEIPVLASRSDIIGKNGNIVATIYTARDISERIKAEQALDARNQDMRMVLENVNQGFITVRKDGVMSPEHSAIVDEWFEPYSEGTTFRDFVAKVDEGFAEWFELAWEDFFEDIMPMEVILDQMPAAMETRGLNLQFSYSAIVDEHNKPLGLLVVIADITDQLEYEKKEAEQREILSVFKRVSKDKSGYMAFLDDSQKLVDTICRLGATDNLVLLKRQVHTLKGNSALFEVNSVAEICHQVEDEMAETGLAPSAEQLKKIRDTFDRFLENTKVFTTSSKKTLELDKTDYDQLITSLEQPMPAEQILNQVKRWHLEPVSRQFDRIEEQAKALAIRLGKGNIEVIKEDNGVRLDPAKWNEFWSSISHIVRNAIDHGIQKDSAEENKGVITLKTVEAEDRFSISIGDNGDGIDWEKVKAKAEHKGLPYQTKDELIAAMFTDGFSTRDNVSETSGRGVGLAAVRQCVVNLNGLIMVESDKGKGTTWRFEFPPS